eukprot:COSAG02_NODE_1169_length_14132_cov_85.570187_2_plen_93_part_00
MRTEYGLRHDVATSMLVRDRQTEMELLIHVGQNPWRIKTAGRVASWISLEAADQECLRPGRGAWIDVFSRKQVCKTWLRAAAHPRQPLVSGN